MPPRIKLKEHLKPEELEKRYRSAQDGVERSHWQIVWLLSSGKGTREVGALTGYSVVWIRELVKRYNRTGPQAMSDTRHNNPGRPVKLSSQQQAALKAELLKAEAASQPWTGLQVATWMSEQL